MNRWLRILKHRWLDESDTRRALDDAALARLQQRIAEGERTHSGEVRLCVEAGLPLSYLWLGAPARERARTLFGKLGVWDTEHNNGVLIYLLLAERCIEIVADRGVARLVAAAHWQALAEAMASEFRAGRFEAGLTQAIAAVNATLAEHFALAPGAPNPNELPDEPVLG